MKEKILNFLQCAFPFLSVLIMWRLSGWFWNPGGILALIPIFFCTFVKQISGFGLFSIVFCFLIDYKFNTLCFWTALFCLFYAVNGFQNIIDLKRMDKNARDAFMVFVGIGIFILMINSFTFLNMLRCVWTFCWILLLYFPITELIKKVHDD